MRHTPGLATLSLMLRSRPITIQILLLTPFSSRYHNILRSSKHKFRSTSSARMSQTIDSNLDGTSNRDAFSSPQAAADTRSSGSHRKQKGPPKKRDTHFLCFPLVTATSIPQLARSLQHFRHVATKPSRHGRSQADGDTDDNEPRSIPNASSEPGSSTAAEEDPSELEPNTNLIQSLPVINPNLQILPGIAHRPPGTFHLTLGVMDLSTKGEMDRAQALLQSMDLTELLRNVLATKDEDQDEERHGVPPETSIQQPQPEDEPTETQSELTSLQRPVSTPPTTRTTQTTISDFDEDNPPQITLTGLSTFPSAKSSRVFFAKPSPSPSSPFPLLQFGQAIRQSFREAGFITETRPLVLHATVANMRYAVQARGGRTSKGKSWRYGKDRWKDGQVDARELIKCFDLHDGDVVEYSKGAAPSNGEAHGFIWAKDIVLDRVAICKMGAEKSDDETLGMVYPPVNQKKIFS